MFAVNLGKRIADEGSSKYECAFISRQTVKRRRREVNYYESSDDNDAVVAVGNVASATLSDVDNDAVADVVAGGTVDTGSIGNDGSEVVGDGTAEDFVNSAAEVVGNGGDSAGCNVVAIADGNNVASDSIVETGSNVNSARCFPLHKLTKEMLLLALSHLRHSDLLNNAALVCSYWNDLSKSTSLIPQVAFCPPGIEIIEKYQQSMRAIACYLPEGSESWRELPLIEGCQNLERLHLTYQLCGDVEDAEDLMNLLISRCPTLKVLHLVLKCINRDIHYQIMDLVANSNITNLGIRTDFFEFDTSSLAKPTGLTTLITETNHMNTNYVASLIAANRTTLSKLKISKLQPNLAKEISECPNLKKLTIESISEKRKDSCVRYLQTLTSTKIKLYTNPAREVSSNYAFLRPDFALCNVTALDLKIFQPERFWSSAGFLTETYFSAVTKLRFRCTFEAFHASFELASFSAPVFPFFDKAANFGKLEVFEIFIATKPEEELNEKILFDVFLRSVAFGSFVNNRRSLRRLVFTLKFPFSDAQKSALSQYNVTTSEEVMPCRLCHHNPGFDKYYKNTIAFEN